MEKRLSERQRADLENLVDRFGLGHVLSALVEMCHEKANHLRSNWQDATTARVWDANAKTIDKVILKITE